MVAKTIKTTTQRPSRRTRTGKGVVDTGWFREKLEGKGLSIRALAKKIDYDYSVLQNIIAGKRSWHAIDIANMALVLGEPMAEVWRRAGILVPVVSETVRLVGSVDSLGAVVLGVAGLPSRVAPRPEGSGLSLEALLSVTPATQVSDGWVYYYVGSEKVEAQAVGRLSVIGCANGSVWVRVLWRSAGGRSWVLRSLGEGGDVTVDVAWAVPVLWIKC